MSRTLTGKGTRMFAPGKLKLATTAFGCWFLIGCEMVTTDVRIDAMNEHGHVASEELPYQETPRHQAATCRTYAGSYALPKSYIRVIVEEKDDPLAAATKGKVYELQSISTLRREDPRHTYCLDYRASPTSDDIISVRKTMATEKLKTGDGERAHFKQTNLLRTVASDGIDRSRVILETLVKTIFTSLAQQARTRRFRIAGPSNIALQLELDPFNPDAMARANASLREMGFCIVLGGYSFNLSTADINWYCSDPIKYSTGEHEPRVRNQTFSQMMADYDRTVPAVRRKGRSFFRMPGSDKLGRGVLYRPLLSYPFYVFGNENPKNKSGWKLRLKQEIQLENISPILSVDLERPFFNQRKTRLEFDAGILRDVCIYKTSELREIVEIPLVVMKSITALPTQIIKLKLNDTNNDRALVAAQEQVLLQQKALLDRLNNPPLPGTTGTVGPLAANGPSTGETSLSINQIGTGNGPFPERVSNSGKERCNVALLPTGDPG